MIIIMTIGLWVQNLKKNCTLLKTLKFIFNSIAFWYFVKIQSNTHEYKAITALEQ